MLGASEVLFVTIILLITVSMISLAYISLTSIISQITSTAASTINNTLAMMSSCITVESLFGNKIYVRNCGRGAIPNSSLNVYIDDSPVAYNLSPSINEAMVGEVKMFLNPIKSGDHALKITTAYAQAVKNFNFDVNGQWNIIQNGDFESDFNQWSQPSYASISSTTYFDGAKSLYISYNGGVWAGVSQCKSYGNYTLGKTYVVTFKYKCDTGNAAVFLGDDTNNGKWSTYKTSPCTANWETLQSSLYMDTDQPSNGNLCVYAYGDQSPSGVYYDNVLLYTV